MLQLADPFPPIVYFSIPSWALLVSSSPSSRLPA